MPSTRLEAALQSWPAETSQAGPAGWEGRGRCSQGSLAAAEARGRARQAACRELSAPRPLRGLGASAPPWPRRLRGLAPLTARACRGPPATAPAPPSSPAALDRACIGSTERYLFAPVQLNGGWQLNRSHLRDLTSDDATQDDDRQEAEAVEREGQGAFAN